MSNVSSNTSPDSATCTLWGGALSLYSGKVRSYLIKKGIAYREFYASHPDFLDRIRPAIGMGVTPVVELQGGVMLQDSTDIIEALEARFPQRPMVPQTPVLRALAWLIDAYASEHLLAMAMHFRWSEPHVSVQRRFLQAEFGRASYLGSDGAVRDRAGERMIQHFSSQLGPLGINADTAAAIEAEFDDLLDRLELHFQHVPYVLGGHPSLADFGLMAPLYAHLGRDPVPAQRMALRAPNVARWVERMNLAAIEDGEFPDIPAAFDGQDTVPPTLMPLLELVFQDWTAELLANAAAFNGWVHSQPDLAQGSMVNTDQKRRVHPTVGRITYGWRGCTVDRNSAPQALWHFSKFQEQLARCQGDAQDVIWALLRRVGGEAASSLRLARPILRRNYVLVVGP